MSVDANIIIDTKYDVLIVPNSAVKSQGNNHYVEILEDPLRSQNGQGFISKEAPVRQKIEIGISGDNFTEIISGINEDDRVIARTVAPAAKNQQTTQAPSLFGAPRAR